MMTFEEWLMSHEERIRKDVNLSASTLIYYINNSTIGPVVDVVFWEMSAIFDIANYSYEEYERYLQSYIDMYRRDYEEQEQSCSGGKGSIVSQLINQG